MDERETAIRLRAAESERARREAAFIAAVIRDWNGPGASAHRDLAEHFADRLASQVPNFNRERFLAAAESE